MKKRGREPRITVMARKWKIGAAGVAGAALIGITGGLAAPLLAAGIGTVLGGIGLGAYCNCGTTGFISWEQRPRGRSVRGIWRSYVDAGYGKVHKRC